MKEEKKANLKDNPSSADDLNQVSGGLREPSPKGPDGKFWLLWKPDYYKGTNDRNNQ